MRSSGRVCHSIGLIGSLIDLGVLGFLPFILFLFFYLALFWAPMFLEIHRSHHLVSENAVVMPILFCDHLYRVVLFNSINYITWPHR